MTMVNKKSVYRYGAEYGVYAGLYLTVMSASLLLFPYFPDGVVIFYLMAFSLPIATILLFQRLISIEPEYGNYSSLLMFGSSVYLFGSLICGLLTIGYMLIFAPNHIYDYVEMVISMLEQSPLKDEYMNEIATTRQMIDERALPTPIEYVFSMMWFTVLLGSLMSMLLAPIVCFFKKVKSKKQ